MEIMLSSRCYVITLRIAWHTGFYGKDEMIHIIISYFSLVDKFFTQKNDLKRMRKSLAMCIVARLLV